MGSRTTHCTSGRTQHLEGPAIGTGGPFARHKTVNAAPKSGEDHNADCASKKESACGPGVPPLIIYVYVRQVPRAVRRAEWGCDVLGGFPLVVLFYSSRRPQLNPFFAFICAMCPSLLPKTPYVGVYCKWMTALWSNSCSIIVGVNRCCLQVGSRGLAGSWGGTLLVGCTFNESEKENESISYNTEGDAHPSFRRIITKISSSSYSYLLPGM